MIIITYILYFLSKIVSSFIIVYIIGLLFYLYTFFHFSRKDKNFKGKHIIIFGASQGLGQAIAFRLSKQGCKISLAARNENLLKETKEKCLSNNKETNCEYYICDINKIYNIKNVFNSSYKKFGFPSLIIITAGIASPGYIEDMSYEVYENDMKLNYFGSLKVLKEFKSFYDLNINDELIKKKDTIDLICTGSVLGLIGSICYTVYCPTKYALKGLCDSLRFELLGTNIKLHYYAPSNIKTPGFEKENKNKPQLCKDMENNVKTISADDAAHYLLNNLDKYVIVTEPDLEICKNGTSFMSEINLIDLFLAPISALMVFISRLSIEKNIMKNKKNKKIKND